MSDIEKIILGAFGAVFVYVVGQIISKYFIEPIYELRKEIGAVRFNLSFHAATIHTPSGRTRDKSDSANESLMRNSCEIIAKLHAVPFFCVTRYMAFGVIPRRESLEKAATQLRGLSTYMYEEGEKAEKSLDAINRRVKSIEQLLRLKSLE